MTLIDRHSHVMPLIGSPKDHINIKDLTFWVPRSNMRGGTRNQYL